MSAIKPSVFITLEPTMEGHLHQTCESKAKISDFFFKQHECGDSGAKSPASTITAAILQSNRPKGNTSNSPPSRSLILGIDSLTWC